ncbi:MAG: hypothetical protein MZU79_01565 [Anaerotruncus sp.]|nr:hypothetical protein [Anaerotruncus sp.]
MKTLNYMRDVIKDIQEETGNNYNLEATPAEGTSYRLAKADKARFPDIITAGHRRSLLYELHAASGRIHRRHLRNPRHAGRAAVALYRRNRPSSLSWASASRTPQTCKALIKKVFTKYKLPYISITPTFSDLSRPRLHLGRTLPLSDLRTRRRGLHARRRLPASGSEFQQRQESRIRRSREVRDSGRDRHRSRQVMIFAGMVKSSLIDYPGKIATVLFAPGCNYNCFYRHNRAIIEDIDVLLDPAEVDDFLLRRQGLIDAIVVSGGEPTAPPRSDSLSPQGQGSRLSHQARHQRIESRRPQEADRRKTGRLLRRRLQGARLALRRDLADPTPTATSCSKRSSCSCGRA